jgi:hypothetical protein
MGKRELADVGRFSDTADEGITLTTNEINVPLLSIRRS